ncbi:MAG: MmgE/PrpD family protein, partial [Acetobacterales bacterium]
GRAAMIVIDDMGAMLAPRDEPEVRTLQQRMADRAGNGEATVMMAGAPKLDRATAAFVNGTTANWCELDEGYRVVGCHAGLYTVPASIAEAEAAGLSTREMLRAVILGYEVVTRFARTWRFPANPRTVHPHSTFAAVGAAASIAAARGLDANGVQAALTAASTLINIGPHDHAVKGALIENAWAGIGAQSGFAAVTCAECGIGGVPDSAWSVFAKVLHGETGAAALTEGLGYQWAVMEGYHKIYSCCQHVHSAVEATLSLIDRLPAGKGAEAIDGIVIETHPLAMGLTNTEPGTTLAARFSMPQALAAACVFGHAGASAFAADTLDHPGIARLRRRVEMRAFEGDMTPPNDRPARVTLKLAGGGVLTAECRSAQGGPDRPWPTDVIFDKAAGNVGDVFPGFVAQARRLAALDRALLSGKWREAVANFVANAAPAKRSPTVTA